MLDKIKTYLNRINTNKVRMDIKKKADFTNTFTESTRPLSNPGCGWYQIYSFNLAEESPLYIACEEEQLVLLRIDIHAYRTTNQIPDKACKWLDQILTFFAEHDKGIILRIVYDTDGHGMEHEPSSIKLVKSHMTQLGSIISRHKGEVLVHQGIFVGSWGEMHSSKFLSIAQMTELVLTLSDAIDGICPIAVRKPVQLRSIVAQLEKIEKTTAQEKLVSLTLFNDGIFGSETDLGTYDSRKDELDWQQTQMQRSFTGGEAIGLTPVSPQSRASSFDASLIIDDLSKMHLSYLNSTYRQEQLNEWKNQSTIWNGETISVYDYIGRHLGYRFTVTKVRFIEKNENKNNKKESQMQGSNANMNYTTNCTTSYTKSYTTIQITIRNTGFANLCEEALCNLLLVSPQVVEQSTQMLEQTSKQMPIQTPEQKIQQEITINCDPRTWDSGKDTVIECCIPVEIDPTQNRAKQNQTTKDLSRLSIKDTYDLYLQLTRKRDGRLITFANKNIDSQFGLLLSRLQISF